VRRRMRGIRAISDHEWLRRYTPIAIGADAAIYLIWDDKRNGNADIFFSRRDPGLCWMRLSDSLFTLTFALQVFRPRLAESEGPTGHGLERSGSETRPGERSSDQRAVSQGS